MDLPIKLKFFRKLELYKQLKELDKQAKRNDVFFRNWEMSKEALKSEAQIPQLYPRPFDELLFDAVQRVLKDNDRERMAHNEMEINVARQVLDFLISRKYAVGKPGEVFFTPDGVWMGEVINECESWWRKIRYQIFYWFVWIVFVFGGITLVGSGVSAIANFVKFVEFLVF